MSGWIKIHRKFAKWGWGDKPEMVSLFLHLLLDANYEDKSWQGKVIERGQVVFGLTAWSEKTGISRQTLRTSIARLKSTGEITCKPTNKFTVVTIVNYKEYQTNDLELTGNSTGQLTHNQHATNTQLTPPKEEKKERKKEKEDSVSDDTGEIAALNLQTIIFTDCLRWLTRATGKTESSLRSLVGKWRKDGDAQLIEAFIRAQKENPLDPVAFIAGCLKPRFEKPKPTQSRVGFL